MAEPISITFQNVAGFNKAFKEMEKKLARGVIRTAIRKGAARANASIKSKTPVGSEETGRRHLRDLLKVAAGRQRRGTISAGVAWPTRAELGIDEDDKYFWPIALEEGHAFRGGGVYGLRGGRVKRLKKTAAKDVPAYPYVSTGWDEIERSMADDVEREIIDGVGRAWESRM